MACISEFLALTYGDLQGTPYAAATRPIVLNILSMAAIKASLDMFNEVGMDMLREKSLKLTGYFEYLINQIDNDKIKIITPSNPDERGCQLSIGVGTSGRAVFEYLSKNGCVLDWRESNPEQSDYGVMRAAPVPLYNSFEDVFFLGKHIKEAIRKIQ